MLQPKLLVKAVNAWVRSAFGNVLISKMTKKILIGSFAPRVAWQPPGWNVHQPSVSLARPRWAQSLAILRKSFSIYQSIHLYDEIIWPTVLTLAM